MRSSAAAARSRPRRWSTRSRSQVSNESATSSASTTSSGASRSSGSARRRSARRRRTRSAWCFATKRERQRWSSPARLYGAISSKSFARRATSSRARSASVPRDGRRVAGTARREPRRARRSPRRGCPCRRSGGRRSAARCRRARRPAVRSAGARPRRRARTRSSARECCSRPRSRSRRARARDPHRVPALLRHGQPLAEMDARVAAGAAAAATSRSGGTLAERARALVARRARSSSRSRRTSAPGSCSAGARAFLAQQHADLVRLLRADLLRALPELREAPAELVEALDVALSFETWDRLRSDQRLGRERAAAALERTVAARCSARRRRDGRRAADHGRRARLAVQPQAARRAALPAHPVRLGAGGRRPRRARCRARVSSCCRSSSSRRDGELEARTDSTPLIRAARVASTRALGDSRRSRASRSSTRCSRTTPTSGSPRRCSTTAGRSRRTSRRRRRSCRAGARPTRRRTRRRELGTALRRAPDRAARRGRLERRRRRR